MANRSNPHATPGWKSEDLIDFEYLLLADASDAHPGDSIAKGELEAFRKERLARLGTSGLPARRAVFRAWLEWQRDRLGGQLPGETWKWAWQALVVLGAAFGMLLGGSLTAALLFYRGDVPVNVPWFLACTLGVQWLILAIASALGLLRVTTHWFGDFHPLRSLCSGLLSALSVGLRKLPGERRMRMQAIWSRIVRRRDVYGSLASWPFLVVTQAFGVWFNIGILVVLLAQVSFKDIDFGWQSSFVESNEVAYRLTTAIAVPWSWFAPHPHPTFAEVAESHFTFKQARSNKAWWPFLCYAIACYGLLVRLVLLVLASAGWWRALSRLTFDHAGCSSLYHRIAGPSIRTQKTAEHEPLAAFTSAPVRASHGSAVLLAAAEVDATASLAGYAARTYGWNILESRTAQVDHPSGNEQLLGELADRASGLAGVAVAIPAERPPIKAIALFLERLANAVGPHCQIVLLLLGREQGDAFAEVARDDLRYWQNFVAVHDLNISLQTWTRS